MMRLFKIGHEGKALAEIVAVAAVSGALATRMGTDPEYYIALYCLLRITQIQRLWK